MVQLKDPPDLVDVDLRARLAAAAGEVTALTSTVDRAVAVYRQALAVLVGVPGGDEEFVEANERLHASSAVGRLGDGLIDLQLRIGAGLWAP